MAQVESERGERSGPGDGRAGACRPFQARHTIEDVNNQIALLRSTVAAIETARAKLSLARKRIIDGSSNCKRLPAPSASKMSTRSGPPSHRRSRAQANDPAGISSPCELGPADAARRKGTIWPKCRRIWIRRFRRCGRRCSKCCRPSRRWASRRSRTIDAQGSDRGVLRPQQDGQPQRDLREAHQKCAGDRIWPNRK